MFGSLMPRVAWAQYSAPLPQLWQQAYEFPGLCTGTTPSIDWSLGITTTRDGGYISAGYGGNGSSTSCTVIQPTLTKFRADQSVEWQYTHPAPASTAGRYSEVIELADGSGFVAAGYINSTTPLTNPRMLITKLAVTNGVVSVVWERFTEGGATVPADQPFLAYYARAFSVREVLADGPNGLTASGFVVGGTFSIEANLIHSFLYMLRLDENGDFLWHANLGRTDRSSGAGAVARPLYSTGTTHIPTATRPAHVPRAGGTITGFALTGEQTSFFNAAGVQLTDIPTNGQPYTTTADLAMGIVVGDPAPQVMVTTVASELHGSTGFASNGNQNTGFPYCPAFARNSVAIPGYDIGTDLEQNEAGNRLVVTGIYNRMGRNLCLPPANPNASPGIAFMTGETYLLEWPLTASTAQVAAPQIVFTGVGGAGEYRPQVEPLPGGGYLLAASKLASSADSATVGQWGQNRYYLAHYSTGTATTPPTRTWGKTFASPSVTLPVQNILACTFGMALTQDGGCLVSGNDNKYDGTNKNHDVIITKLRQCLTITSSFEVVAANNALPANNWTTARRVRGTVTVKNGGVLTISGPAALIEFADTRTYQLPGTPKTNPLNPTRILVEPGGKLVIRDGAHLNVLNDAACGAAGLMWDGIILKGVPTKAQTPADQPVIELSGCTIENAHVGVLAGRMNYSASGLPAPALNDGGGLVTATNVLFRNCFNGVNLQTYGRTATATQADINNGSRFTSCTFRADALLADPLYITAPTATPANVRLPSQAGLKVFTTQGVQVLGCTFELVGDDTPAGGGTPTGDGTTPFVAMVPTNQRGLGIYASNSNIMVKPSAAGVRSTFRGLYIGLTSSNISMAYPAFVDQTDFVNCVGGIFLSGVSVPTITNNVFTVGRATDSWPYGLSLYNSYGYDVSHNTFSSPCPTARGLNVALSDGSNTSGLRSNLLYDNRFSHLNTGIFAQRGNSSLLLKCNNFETPPVPTIPPTIPPTPNPPIPDGTISRADVEVAVGTQPSPVDPLKNHHGDCDVQNASLAIRNVFSHTTGGKSFWVTGTVKQLEYNSFNNLAPTSGSYTLNVTATNCPVQYLQSCDCPAQRPTALRTVAQLRASLDSLTTAEARAEVLDELLRRYLNPTLYTHGTDSAVALLQQTPDVAYAEQRTALEGISSYTPANRTIVPSVTGNSRWHRRKATRQALGGTTPAARTGTSTYFDEVRELLAPLGSDSAIAATLKVNTALRARFEQIANDTTTWGYVAGQTVLSRYLGYKFRPWFDGAPDLSFDAFRTAGGATASGNTAAVRLKAALALYPNPATDAVQLDCQQPDGSEGVWELHDQFGKLCRRVSLVGKAANATVTLTGLRPGLYYYYYVVGHERVQAGTLQKQ